MLKEQFKKLYNVFKWSKIKIAAIEATMLSLFMLFIVCGITWIISPAVFWIGFIVAFITFIIYFIIKYLLTYPTEKAFARKLDELGLQQRVITMYEYADEESLIARIQRENATMRILAVNPANLRTALKAALTILLAISIIFATAGITVNALSITGKINTGKEVINEIVPGVINQYEVVYDIDGEGFIDGDIFQVVREGEDATPVMAVADDNWFFLKWSDGVENPYRQDLAIYSNIEIFAIFAELDESDQEGEGGEGEPGDADKEGEPNEQGDQGNNQSVNDEPGTGEGGGEGGKYEPNNQVIDGETYYGDKTFSNAYDDAINYLSGNGSMSQEEKSLIENYYKVIQK